MRSLSLPGRKTVLTVSVTLCLVLFGSFLQSGKLFAAAVPEPLVAIHVSELTRALETMPATPPTPNVTGASGYEWFYTSWHYFVGHESLKEALRSDGTPFVEISDSDITAGKLRKADGSPSYPILISLASEAIADSEISRLQEYVNAGGFLVVGSSSFTRNPDGTTRGDFALAAEMGLHMLNPNLINWYENAHFTKGSDHRLVSHIPAGTLVWRAALASDEIPIGVSPSHLLHGGHYAWQIVASGATVLANGDEGPLLTVRNYGTGQIIYHGVFQPLISHGGTDPGMYSYLIYRKAIEWAFESFGLPLVKVSPWPYQYDSAFLVRHDFENDQASIRSIETSAQFEKSLGVKGDYFFCTGALRDDMAGNAAVIAGLKNAVTSYGATIGSHNGGLKNPLNPGLVQSDYDYWHWGPDEALDTAPAGYADGKAYASASILKSFTDIEGWLAGLDNGRAGCGATASCPRIWVAPYFNSTREGSREIMDELGAVLTMGEQKVGPFPHRSFSYLTPGKLFSTISTPVSDWYVGAEISPRNEDQNIASIRAAIDFYYNLGALINFYGHEPSHSGTIAKEYITYSLTKPKLWPSNAVGINDWWRSRSNVAVAPQIETTGNTYVATAAVSGATDPATAIEMVIPPIYTGNVNVYLDGSPASSENYRTTANGVKVRVGAAVKTVRVQNTVSLTPDLSSLSLNPGTIAGGLTSQGTVTLSGPAPAGGVTVSLSDNSTVTTLPASVTVPGGSSSTTFTITTTPVTASTSPTISAVYKGVTKTARLTVNPPALSSVSVNPGSVTGGTTSQGTVTLSGPATTGGVRVTLSDNSTAATLPASVTVPGGSSSTTFTITTLPVTSSRSVTITARYLLVTKTAALMVTPPSTAGLSIDVTTFRDSSVEGNTIATPAFTSKAGNELLLAFVTAPSNGTSPNTLVSGITGGGLTWSLVRRTNAQPGTAEIWKAFATAPLSNVTVTATLSQSFPASITVVSFSGVNVTTPVGAAGGGSASTGAPTASLTTQGANSWVFGVGVDWDHAAARTVGANQSMVHQNLDPNDYTTWVQRQNATVQPVGTVVTINDTSPTGDRWNLSIVEIRQ